jgi:ureidoacrylate peracid hydrolase
MRQWPTRSSLAKNWNVTQHDPAKAFERVIARRGRGHIYDDLDPRKTALVVVDMQNAFTGRRWRIRSARWRRRSCHISISWRAPCVQLAAPWLWIVTTFTEEALTSWSTYFHMAGKQQTQRRIAALSAGAKGHELWARLDVQPGDPVVEKNRFSAFIQGSSKLVEVLQARGIDTLLVTGIDC